MTSGVVPAERPGSPGSLIVSFAGSFLREIGGWIAVSDLITCLGTVGVPAPAVRQALVRLKGRGFLAAERRSVAGYALTEAGLADLKIGDRRIFRYGEAAETDGWVLAVFSVPESDRAHRHRLRSLLTRLGFGTVAPGVWIAPAPSVDSARAELAETGLGDYVTWFRGESLQPVVTADWWDLGQLAQMYDEFITAHAGVGPVAGDTDPVDPVNAFGGYLPVIDAWRQFPRQDPGLPRNLLPPDWPGRTAWELFDRTHTHWHAPALDYVRRICVAD